MQEKKQKLNKKQILEMVANSRVIYIQNLDVYEVRNNETCLIGSTYPLTRRALEDMGMVYLKKGKTYVKTPAVKTPAEKTPAEKTPAEKTPVESREEKTPVVSREEKIKRWAVEQARLLDDGIRASEILEDLFGDSDDADIAKSMKKTEKWAEEHARICANGITASEIIEDLFSEIVEKPDIKPDTPAEKTPAEKTPVEKTLVEKTPVEKTPVEKTPALPSLRRVLMQRDKLSREEADRQIQHGRDILYQKLEEGAIDGTDFMADVFGLEEDYIMDLL